MLGNVPGQPTREFRRSGRQSFRIRRSFLTRPDARNSGCLRTRTRTRYRYRLPAIEYEYDQTCDSVTHLTIDAFNAY